ncbi:hypothetical protein GIB67_023702 [Kingdonia uniflora]|uniref:Uncharacterized protein n=1 Tax=Kingdonia uniflora TaxID=39325 RepID=A0A7J7MG84_9MAGN|nr:hypothetical protein GIB67_023702 [Kingdonia uniflora]
MNEDRFDLWTFQIQPLEQPVINQTEERSLWKKLIFNKRASTLPSLCSAAIKQLSVPVKRTMELRALSGWRYYFSLFLEFSDITMPFARSVVEKISSAISFFLVYLIGRSLGLIYTGIRQALGWRLFSEYIGLDTMMAIVCKTLKGVKALETYDKEG